MSNESTKTNEMKTSTPDQNQAEPKSKKKKPLESNFLNMLLVLVLVGILSGLSVGGVFEITKEPIEENQKIKRRDALSETLGTFDNDPLAESQAGLYESTIYTAKTGSELVGYAVQVISPLGYGGEMEAMVGFNNNLEVTGVSVIKHSETPGLGTNVLKDRFRLQYVGLSATGDPIELSSNGGQIDAISGVTFSSRALTDAVNKAAEAVREGVR
jgi:electron transport complex protein RnfG